MEIFEIKAKSKASRRLDGELGQQEVCYLTLADVNLQSENRYYVSLCGKEAGVEWREGDKLILNISLVAYKAIGQWHLNTFDDTLKLVDIKGE